MGLIDEVLFFLCRIVTGVLTVRWLDVSEPRTGAKPKAWSSAAVRVVLKCIVGRLVGCYGDLAGSVLPVHELHLSPLSLGSLVNSPVFATGIQQQPPFFPFHSSLFVMNYHLLSPLNNYCTV